MRPDGVPPPAVRSGPSRNRQTEAGPEPDQSGTGGGAGAWRGPGCGRGQGDGHSCAGHPIRGLRAPVGHWRPAPSTDAGAPPRPLRPHRASQQCDRGSRPAYPIAPPACPQAGRAAAQAHPPAATAPGRQALHPGRRPSGRARSDRQSGPPTAPQPPATGRTQAAGPASARAPGRTAVRQADACNPARRAPLSRQ